MGGDAVEGPLKGYHHETYVIRLPAGAGGVQQARGKFREPRENLLWFDRRCFASEEQLLLALKGHVTSIPDLIEVEGLQLQRFIEGRTLGSRYKSDEAVPEAVFEQIVDLFREMLLVTPEELRVDRRCDPEDRAADGDTAGFLERLICFAEDRVYEDNRSDFEALFGALGVEADSFKRLRKHVSGLAGRPFCLLHADLHRENFILDRQDQLWVIDWELAMLGDPLYDLATHLYLMDYPRDQQRRMAERWSGVAERIRPGSSRRWQEDLPRLIDFKKAQSVFTDVIRASLSLEAGSRFNWSRLPRSASRVQKVLARAAEPLGLETVPSRAQVLSELVKWYRLHH